MQHPSRNVVVAVVNTSVDIFAICLFAQCLCILQFYDISAQGCTGGRGGQHFKPMVAANNNKSIVDTFVKAC